MKVLYITNFDLMYGANRSLFFMMQYLKNHYDVEPYLLVPGGGEIGKLCEKENIPCFTYDFRISYIQETTKNLQFRRFTRRIMRKLEAYMLYRKINRTGIAFDLVHSNSSIFDIGYYFARKWGIPHIWHIREFARKDYSLVNVLPDYITGREYKHSAAVIAISDAIQKYIMNYAPNINIARIYNGIEIPEEYPKVYQKDQVVNYCITGVIKPQKGQMDVVKACAGLLEMGKKKFRLYIVGDYSGEETKRIREYMDGNIELTEHIVFAGYRNDVPEFLKDMDVGIMASEAEAFGRVTIEYMANYMPVIGTNSGGTPELINGVGDVYEPHDIMQLEKCMVQYMDNPELLCKRGIESRNRAKDYSVESNSSKIYRTYKDITDSYINLK